MELVVESEYPTVAEDVHYDRVVFFNEYRTQATIKTQDFGQHLQQDQQ